MQSATTATAAVAAAGTHRPASRYSPLVLVLAAVCAGIAADRVLDVPLPAWWLAGGLLLAGWAVLALQRATRWAAVGLLLAGVALGGAWHHRHWSVYDANDLALRLTEESIPLAAEVRALEAPRRIAAPPYSPLRALPGKDRSRLEVEVLAVRDGDAWGPASGLAVLSVDGHLLGVEAGDRLLLWGHASLIPTPRNPGEMDLAAHHRADRLRVQLRVAFPDGVQVLEKGAAWSMAAVLDAARRAGDRLLWSHLHHERSGMAAALLLGAREQLEHDRVEAFFQTNTIHFLAISGLHVGILAGSLFYALRFGLLPRRLALLCAAAATIAYTLLTGAQPSSVRAAVLVLLVCTSLLTGRPVSAFHCLAAAGLVILARNPADLFRIGPQLSFLAVGAICWFGPQWRAWMQRDGLTAALRAGTVWPLRAAAWLLRWWLRATLVTAVVWLVTLPLIMTQFHLVSPVAIVLSPIVGLPIAVALLCGFGVLLLGWLAPPLAYLAARLCDASLGVIDLLVTHAATWPGSHFWVAGPPVWWLLGFYGGLLGWAAAGARRPKARYALVVLGLWIAIGYAVRWWHTRPADEVRCAFLAVGHGCCIVVHLPDGRTLLYDAGSLAAPHRAARVAGGYFWHTGVRKIDVLVVSHNDVDHYNGVPELLEQFPVGRLWIGPRVLDDPSPATRVLRHAVQQAGIDVRPISAGHEAHFGACRIRVLHPPAEGVPGSDNANSLVLVLEYAGHRVLLTGDLEPPGLNDLLRAPPLACDVVLAPHHGSVRSDPPGLAAWSSPRWVVVSGGDHREAQAVVQTYQQLGAQVRHTDRDGAVLVRCTRQGLEVRSFRPVP